MPPIPLTKKFGKAVARIRKERGLSQEKLADLCKMHRNHMGEIERGEINVSLVSVEKIARVLKMSAGDLLKEAEK